MRIFVCVVCDTEDSKRWNLEMLCHAQNREKLHIFIRDSAFKKLQREVGIGRDVVAAIDADSAKR